ncbi:type II secretion system F family protein [Humibacillus xanthopallidus]|uniref:type II secretion system F family protein n=1 Tax=Humibacillus xanthopallidus TaxID=412689 RepID=UPI0038515695
MALVPPREPSGGRVVTWSAVTAALLVAAAVLVLPGRPEADDGGEGQDEQDEQAEQSGDDGRARPQRRARRGRRSLTARDPDEVASALALLPLAYRTGLPTWQVLIAVAQTGRDPVAADLRQVATALQWGASETEAWASVGPAWTAAARVVSLAHAGGVPPGPLLTAASDDLHRAELDRLEVAAAQVGVRLVAPLGLVLLPAFCLTTVVPLVVALGSQLLVG